MKCIVGKKLGMTTLYDPEKGAVPITLLECQPNTIELVRTEEKDGYRAIQVSLPISKKKSLKKEFAYTEGEFAKGETISVEDFEEGEKVTLVGTTKGKGFQGVVKRHGFKGSPATHGHRHDLRAPGSIGSAYPQHVMKGKKMAGRMGFEQKTVKNVKVIQIDKENNTLSICGAVPGSVGSVVALQKI